MQVLYLLREDGRCRVDLEVWVRLAKQVFGDAVVHQDRNALVIDARTGDRTTNIDAGDTIKPKHTSSRPSKRSRPSALSAPLGLDTSLPLRAANNAGEHVHQVEIFVFLHLPAVLAYVLQPVPRQLSAPRVILA